MCLLPSSRCWTISSNYFIVISISTVVLSFWGVQHKWTYGLEENNWVLWPQWSLFQRLSCPGSRTESWPLRMLYTETLYITFPQDQQQRSISKVSSFELFKFGSRGKKYMLDWNGIYGAWEKLCCQQVSLYLCSFL